MLGKISEYQDPEIYSYIDAPEEVELTSQEEASAEVARPTVESPAQGELPAEVASQTGESPAQGELPAELASQTGESIANGESPAESAKPTVELQVEPSAQETVRSGRSVSPKSVADRNFLYSGNATPLGTAIGGASRRYRVLLNKKKKTRQHRKYNKRTRRN